LSEYDELKNVSGPKVSRYGSTESGTVLEADSAGYFRQKITSSLFITTSDYVKLNIHEIRLSTIRIVSMLRF